MFNKNEVLFKVEKYRKFQQLFQSFCNKLSQATTKDNSYGIVMGESECNSAKMLILDFPCELDLSLVTGERQLTGQITIKRNISDEEFVQFFALFFDELGNASEQSNGHWPHSLKDDESIDRLMVRMLEEFFQSIGQ
jgi:hypothetical protein